MKHKLYIWETFDTTIKLVQFNSYKEIVTICDDRGYPSFKTPEFLEAFLSTGDRTLYAFPIVENHVKVLAYYDNKNFARKELEWFKNIKKDTNVKRNVFSRKKR